MSNEVMLPNGDRQLTLSFIAPSEYQMIIISCFATRVNNMGMLVDINQSIAVLMIQGKTKFKFKYSVTELGSNSHVVGSV